EGLGEVFVGHLLEPGVALLPGQARSVGTGDDETGEGDPPRRRSGHSPLLTTARVRPCALRRRGAPPRSRRRPRRRPGTPPRPPRPPAVRGDAAGCHSGAAGGPPRPPAPFPARRRRPSGTRSTPGRARWPGSGAALPPGPASPPAGARRPWTVRMPP